MCENAYLSIKNPKASRALKRALDPSRRMLTSLAATPLRYVGNFRPQKLGPPLDQILDPHLLYTSICSECVRLIIFNRVHFLCSQ